MRLGSGAVQGLLFYLAGKGASPAGGFSCFLACGFFSRMLARIPGKVEDCFSSWGFLWAFWVLSGRWNVCDRCHGAAVGPWLSASLKGKRGVLKRIQAKVANQFNISVTECGDQDLWQSAVLGFGVVGTSQAILEATLQNIVEFVDAMGLAEVGRAETEFYHC